MATVVVPFRSGGKSRLPAELRVEVALAMLGDVLEAATAHAGRVRLVTDDDAAALIAAALGVEVVADPGGGQGAAVAGCARRGRRCLPRRQRRRAAGAPAGPRCARRAARAGRARDRGRRRRHDERARPARSPAAFAAALRARQRRPVPGARAAALGLDVHDLELPNLRDDVDTRDRLATLGPRTRALAVPRVNVVLLSRRRRRRASSRAGLHDVLAPGELTVIGNVGDDLEVLGLHVSPDLDSRPLRARRAERRGTRLGARRRDLAGARVGRARWGGEGWFMLGDLDLGLHLVRTQALRGGEPLSAVTAAARRARGPRARASCPATDDRLRTHLVTPQGTFAFQEWFVARRHEDEVDALVFEGADAARPAPGVLEALAAADAIVIAPSNPYVSIHPILAVPGDPRRARGPERALGRRQPADRRPRRPGPARPYAAAARRRDDARRM